MKIRSKTTQTERFRRRRRRMQLALLVQYLTLERYKKIAKILQTFKNELP